MAVMCSCETFHIVPVNSTCRPNAEPCYTLSQLANETEHLSVSYLTLYFLPGDHFLNQQLNVRSIPKVKMFTLSVLTTVWLQDNKITASKVRKLEIANLTFVSSNSIVPTLYTIYIRESGNIILTGCTFIETMKSMIMLVESNSTTMSDCVFNGSLAVETITVYSIVSTFSTYLDISNCHFFDNKQFMHEVSTVNVFSIYLLQINHCTFVSHGLSGGGIKIESNNGIIHISNSDFRDNRVSGEGGVVYILNPTRAITIENSTFTNNIADDGGIIYVPKSNYFRIAGCIFTNNNGRTANVIQASNTHSMSIIDCKFIDNANSDTTSAAAVAVEVVRNILYVNESIFVNNLGGGILVDAFGSEFIYITNCMFSNNRSPLGCGGISVAKAIDIRIVGCIFTNNTGLLGGAVKIYSDSRDQFTMDNCIFADNFALNEWSGGALFSRESSVTIKNTVFTNNYGADVVTIIQSAVKIENTTFIQNNASNHRVLTLLQSSLTLKQFNFNYNQGYIYLFSDQVYVMGETTLKKNTGGAIRAIQSKIYIHGTENTLISGNIATSGGGITLRESELFIRSPINISENMAVLVGGGIYAYQSLIQFDFRLPDIKKSFITDNFAFQNGGGLCIVASTIKVSRFHVSISSNTALHSGGGLYLQENSKIYVFKQDKEVPWYSYVNLTIANNTAISGGGIYVADNSTTGELQCQGEQNNANKDDATVSPDCFVQTIRLYKPVTRKRDYIKFNTFIINNTAEAGSALYGGLIDRCSVSILAEVYEEKLSGSQYINKTVMISNGSSVTSDPVQVVFCNEYNGSEISIRKGDAFKIHVSAIDQIGQPLKAMIYSSVTTESGIGRLKEGQAEQRVGNQCTELEYNVFSLDSFAQVEIYADGPCSDFGISKKSFSVTFLPCTCPIGFQSSPSQIECKCVCDQRLQPYQITNCSGGTIKLETDVWIGVANQSRNGTGFVIHDCPFDYCVEKPVNISLNSSQERDRQCTFNRIGVLCGECQQGLSLVLSTSQCKKCSNIHLLLLIPFSLAGILLVAFILFFNITVATGTINGLIFYSNLLPAQYFIHPSTLTVLISWVNLDLGIETCFYNGMSSQAKVLLQLVFPGYLFLLIILVIILSRYSNFFATLLSNRNPVATLSTLLFLSYSKLLRFVIAALQSTVLQYPDDLNQRVWLYDANVLYYTPSHAPRFAAAILILIMGGLITLQLFFAQWFPHCSKWKLMKWTRNTKYTGFMDTYQGPFTRKYRFWLGLLLFSLIIHNVITANAGNNFLPVLSMGCIAMGLIIILKSTKNRVYKYWLNDFFETTFLLNLIFLAFGTFYVQITKTEYLVTTLVNVSIGLSVCLFLVIVCHHSYKYVYLQSRFHRRHKTRIKSIFTTAKKNLSRGTKMEELVTEQRTDGANMKLLQKRDPDLDVLAPITTDDYRPPSPRPNTCPKVTYAIIERELDTVTTEQESENHV